ncbi:hypothetical protein GQ457_08G033440 [Hibiscus cannabinus]
MARDTWFDDHAGIVSLSRYCLLEVRILKLLSSNLAWKDAHSDGKILRNGCPKRTMLKSCFMKNVDAEFCNLQSYFMWDSFRSDVAVSIMCNSEKNNGGEQFAEMEYMNITVVTSNEGGLHSGHV